MIFKCILKIGESSYDVTDDLENWDEVTASYKREDYGGVIRSFSSKFNFVGEARLFLKDLFDESYLKSSAGITISTRNDKWEFDDRFSCEFDFSTLEDDGRVLSINAIDNSIAAVIKAKKGISYEFPVSDIKDDEPLRYDGINIQSFYEWTVGGSSSNDSIVVAVEGNGAVSTLPLYMTEGEILHKSALLVQDSKLEKVDSDNDKAYSNYVVKARKDISIHLQLHFSYRFVGDGGMVMGAQKIWLGIISLSGILTKKDVITSVGQINIADYNNTINLSEGDVIVLLTQVDSELHNTANLQIISPIFRIDWEDRISPIDIDVIRPETLLNVLLKQMNEGKEGISGVIRGDTDWTSGWLKNRSVVNTRLCAAESIRGIKPSSDGETKGAKAYTSFSQFAQWMESVFGYIYEVSGNQVIFDHRNNFFSGTVIKNIYEYDDYKMSLDSELIFAQVSTGYKKQNYESVNGRDEFNFTNNYTTGVLNATNKLELISPYRADSFGIEFLAEKRGEDTTDDSSDKDLFFVGIDFDIMNSCYVVDRSYPVLGVNSPQTIFNVMYAPSTFIEANKGYIGACTDNLDFASSDGNSDVNIDGKEESRSIGMSDKLFSVKVIELETPDMDLPENKNGIIALHKGDGIVYGHFLEADCRFTKEQSETLKLIVK